MATTWRRYLFQNFKTHAVDGVYSLDLRHRALDIALGACVAKQ